MEIADVPSDDDIFVSWRIPTRSDVTELDANSSVYAVERDQYMENLQRAREERSSSSGHSSLPLRRKSKNAFAEYVRTKGSNHVVRDFQKARSKPTVAAPNLGAQTHSYYCDDSSEDESTVWPHEMLDKFIVAYIRDADEELWEGNVAQAASNIESAIHYSEIKERYYGAVFKRRIYLTKWLVEVQQRLTLSSTELYQALPPSLNRTSTEVNSVQHKHVVDRTTRAPQRIAVVSEAVSRISDESEFIAPPPQPPPPPAGYAAPSRARGSSLGNSLVTPIKPMPETQPIKPAADSSSTGRQNNNHMHETESSGFDPAFENIDGLIKRSKLITQKAHGQPESSIHFHEDNSGKESQMRPRFSVSNEAPIKILSPRFFHSMRTTIVNWLDLGLHSRIMQSTLKLVRPKIRDGYQRLEWTCSCGHAMYGDYTGSALDEFARRLSLIWRPRKPELPSSQTASPYRTQPVEGQDPEKDQKKSTHDTIHVEDAALHGTSSTPSEVSPYSNSNDDFQLTPSTSSSSSSLPTSLATPVQTQLELCIHRNKDHIRIGEIPIVNAQGDFLVKSDFELFAKVKVRYNENRRGGRLGFLYRPFDMRFVEFGIRRGINQVGIYNKEENEIPPTGEVEEGRYHYYECPLNQMPPMDRRTFFHYFWDHASHQPTNDMTFLDRLPKKLGCSILMAPNTTPLTKGWGVHIIEGANWPLIPWLVVVVLFVALVVAVVYDVALKGQESGFTVGQLVFSLLMAVLSSIFSYVVDTV